MIGFGDGIGGSQAKAYKWLPEATKKNKRILPWSFQKEFSLTDTMISAYRDPCSVLDSGLQIWERICVVLSH